MLAVIFAGLTINSYNNIEDLTKFHKYYHLKELFVSFIVFLMVILPLSLFDSKNVPRIMTILVEYLSPIAVVIMMCLLVIYSNDLSKLSNKELVGDISSKDDEEKPVVPPPTTDKISRNVFDGVEPTI
jgi:amino acid permease